MRHDAALGELRDGDIRYLLVRHDSLMGLFTRLHEPARNQALAALADSVAEHGGRSAARYRAEDPEKLLVTIAAKASQLGWGRWTFERKGDSIELTVENSPFAQGHGPSAGPVCAAITGMLRATAALVLGGQVHAEEFSCAATGAATCVFRAQSR